MINLIAEGYNLADILILANNNISSSQMAKYGIINGTEASFVSKFIQSGYSIEVMEKLARYGIEPSVLSK